VLSSPLLLPDKHCNFSDAKSFALLLSLTLAGLISSRAHFNSLPDNSISPMAVLCKPYFLHNNDPKKYTAELPCLEGLDFHQKDSAKVNKQTNETLKTHEMYLVREYFFLCFLVSF